MSFGTIFVITLLFGLLVMVIIAPWKGPPEKSDSRVCSQCGTTQPHHARFCRKCGRGL
jgi:hypothetical protein